MPRKIFEPRQLTAADIFSGAGGLTLGLKAGGFRVVAGIEVEGHAVSTFKINHPDVHAFKQDVTTIAGRDLLEVAPSGRIDLLAGCPPCQGFTSLTSKYRRADPRNQLVLEMARLVEEIQPLAIMMENVPGLVQKGKPLFAEFLGRIESQGYMPEWNVLQVADYGVPQSRRRLVLLAGKGFRIALPPPTYSRTGIDGLPKWRTVGSVLRSMPTPVTLSEANARDGAQSLNWHVVRSLSDRNQSRLRHARPGEHWQSIPKHLRPNCHQDANAGFSNVYGRMSWDEVSPTITAGCTTFSKGRFGHPEEHRTISVLEAALLQTFPRHYVFSCPYMEYVCRMIGNALPCDFATVLAFKCADAIHRHQTETQRKGRSPIFRETKEIRSGRVVGTIRAGLARSYPTILRDVRDIREARPMATKTTAIVRGRDGLLGTIEHGEALAVAGGDELIEVRLEDGRLLHVPADLLLAQQDGSYALAYSASEILGLAARADEPIVVPLMAEEVEVAKRRVETGKVRVRKTVRTTEQIVDEPVFREEVEVERVAVNRVLDAPIGPHQEGDTLVVPLLEEVLVVEKRLMLREEIRITRRRSEHRDPQTITLRTEEAAVERVAAEPPDGPHQ